MNLFFKVFTKAIFIIWKISLLFTCLSSTPKNIAKFGFIDDSEKFENKRTKFFVPGCVMQLSDDSKFPELFRGNFEF